MSKCVRCERYNTANTVRMIGSGPTDAEVIIVGDYPHIEADLAGTAFVGRIPEILKDYFKKAGLPYDKFYYTYAVKCGGDAPTKEEMRQCKPYLNYEINKVRPKYIVTLGNEALQAVTGKSGITKYRGNELEETFLFQEKRHDCIVFPTVSPAAVLRMPKYKKMFETDLNSLHRMLNGDYKQPEHNIVYCMTKEKLNEAYVNLMMAVGKGSPIGFDLETEGFDYWRPEKRILTMSLSVDNFSFPIPLGHPESPFRNAWVKIIQLFKPIFEQGKIITQNGKFDAKWLMAKAGIKLNLFFDTMLASYILDENTPHNLEYLSQVYLKTPTYKSMVDQSKLAEEPLHLVLKYNAMDTHYTVRLYDPLVTEIKQKPRLAVIFKKLLMGAFDMYTRSEMIGMWVDKPMLMERYNHCINELNRIQALIDGHISPEFTEKYLTKRYKTKPDKIESFNLNSPKQKAALLFEDAPVGLGLPITMTTATGNPSTSEEALVYLRDKASHPVIDLITEYQGWEQHRKMFLAPWQEKLDSNDRMHPNFKLLTVTGRTSCEDPKHTLGLMLVTA